RRRGGQRPLDIKDSCFPRRPPAAGCFARLERAACGTTSIPETCTSVPETCFGLGAVVVRFSSYAGGRPGRERAVSLRTAQRTGPGGPQGSPEPNPYKSGASLR